MTRPRPGPRSSAPDLRAGGHVAPCPGNRLGASAARGLLALSLSACGGGVTVGEAYTLTLRPVLGDQPDLLDGADLRVAARGDVIDATGDGTWDAPDVEALEDEPVGLLWSEGPGPAGWRAHGRSDAVTIADGALTRFVPVAPARGASTLGTLTTSQLALLGAAAITPDGTMWLLGGAAKVHDAALQEAGSALVFTADLGEAALPFTQRATLVDNSGGVQPRVGLTATVVEADGPRILVAGGRERVKPATGALNSVVLLDPATGEVSRRLVAPTARSQHVAVRLGARVLLLGGLNGSGQAPEFTFDVVDLGEEPPRTTAITEQSNLGALGTLGIAHAVLDDNAVLVCGGLVNPSPATYAPRAGCARLAAIGTVNPAADIAEGVADVGDPRRAWSAMARLADGRVLLTGGIDEDVSDLGTASAVADAFLYDPTTNTWTRADDLLVPRAMHALVAMPDGSALVIGGADAGYGVSPTTAVTLRTSIERFDPTTNTFEDAGATDAAAGALPLIAHAPGRPSLLVAGFGATGSGTAWGVLGGDPGMDLRDPPAP